MISPEFYTPELPVSDWKLIRDGLELGQVQRFERGLDQTKIFTKSLNGTVNIQTIGRPIYYANVQLGCTLRQRDMVNLAEADGAFLTMKYIDVDKALHVYNGYIESAPQWTTVYPGEYYTCTFKYIYEI